jgi:sugar phosphate isomerase/epimerase
MLGPYLDEIELLLFESRPQNALPSQSIIAELARLAKAYNLTYNIHLPIDVSISDPHPDKQKHAVETLLNIIDLTEPLSPTAYTLHIPSDNDSIDNWQRRVSFSLEKILAGGVAPHLIAVETLDYSFDLLDAIIDEFDLSVCLDLGHLMIRAVDTKSVFNTYRNKISIVHLHGFNNDGDHMALDQLSAQCVQSVLWILKRFKGTVSLEVFSFEDLNASLDFFDQFVDIANQH